MKKPRSIQGRLIIFILLGFALLLTATFSWVGSKFTNQLEHEFDRNLLTKAMTLVTLTTQETGKVELDFADEFMPEFEALEQPEYFELWLADGTLLERSHSLGAKDLPLDKLPLDTPHFSDTPLHDGRNGRLVQIRFVPHSKDNPDDPEGTETNYDSTGQPLSAIEAHFSVARGREELDALISSTWWTLGGTGLLLLFAVAFLVANVVKRGLTPLREISAQVSALDAKSLHQQIRLDDDVLELTPVITQLNKLLGRLDDSFHREKRFSGDVAHELRTPVAELRAIAEVGGKWPRDEVMMKHFFGDLLSATEEMETTITNLLTLARCESGIQHVEE